MDNNKPDRHPSYGTVGFYRMYGNKPTALFGSSIPHSQTIQLVVHRAKTERKLCQDFISPTDEILRLEISYTQFAELLTNKQRHRDSVYAALHRNRWFDPTLSVHQQIRNLTAGISRKPGQNQRNCRTAVPGSADAV